MQYLPNENTILTEHDPRIVRRLTRRWSNNESRVESPGSIYLQDKPNESEGETEDIDIIMRIRIENVFILSYSQNSL